MVSQLDIELGALSALVNGQMGFLTTDSVFGHPLNGARGDDIGNFIRTSFPTNPPTNPPTNLFGAMGYAPVTVEYTDIKTFAPAINSYPNMFGMAAATFKKGDVGVIAFRGTETSIADWGTDFDLGIGGLSPQIYAAYNYTLAAIAELQAQGVTEIKFTGHSLGGALASIMARYFGGEAVVFDAAPNRGSAENLADGAPAYIPLPSPELFPAIPPSTKTAADSVIRIHYAENDPVSQAVGSSGGGRLGDNSTATNTRYNLNVDHDVFSDASSGPELVAHSAAATAASFNIPLGVDADAINIHSIHLLLLQMLLDEGTVNAMGERNNRLGTVSENLRDLMTQTFNTDVSLRHEIGDHLGVANPEMGNNSRYDLFFRQLVDDKVNKYGFITDMWLKDLEDLAKAEGRLGAAGVGTEPFIKSIFEWFANDNFLLTEGTSKSAA
jgi:hypothetical protein